DRELARARIQTGHLQAACDPAQVLARVLRVLQRTPKGGDILWDMPPGEDTRAAIDAGDLTEALGALLENALRHSHSRVTVSLQVAGRLLHIAIQDDGPGVPEDQLHRMIRRGVRLDENGEGQGIGLSIAQEIAEAAGGALAFENAAPGLRATLTLRCAAPVA
ncbi:MAG: ATP-binding protein, partial [Gemmobacter sp.]